MNQGDLSNVKSDYFLHKIFECIKKPKALKIMKINKKIQKRLNLSINDYKECSRIEIELKLTECDPKNKYFKHIIHVPEGNNDYYHIYFDGSKEEIKRNYLEENEKVKTVKIIIDHQVKSFKSMFSYCKLIKSIFFKNFYRTNITNMSFMFYECSSLEELIIPNFDTENVTDMSFMFCECSSLKELNVSNFKTSKVTNM